MIQYHIGGKNRGKVTKFCIYIIPYTSYAKPNIIGVIIFVRLVSIAADGFRRVENFLKESILISFDFIWKVWLSDRNICLCVEISSLERFFFKTLFTLANTNLFRGQMSV